MPRVEIGTQSWGWLADTRGNAAAGRSVTISGTVYDALTGGNVLSQPLITRNDGTIPGYVENGTYTVTTSDVVHTVEAVSAQAVGLPGPTGPAGPQGIQGAAGVDASAGQKLLPFSRPGKLSIAVGGPRIYLPQAMDILGVTASVGTASAGNRVAVDLNRNGSTIFTTQANRPIISPGANVSATVVPDLPSISAGSYLTVDVDEVGLTQATFIDRQAMVSGAGTSKSIPRTPLAQNGDIHIAIIKTEDGGVPGITPTPPTGWTLIGSRIDQASAAPFSVDRYWFRDDGVAGPYVWTFPQVGSWRSGYILTYRGLLPTGDPIDTASSAAQGFSSSYVAPSVTTSQPGDLLVMWGLSANNQTANAVPAGMNVRWPTAIPGSATQFAGDQMLGPLPGATGTRTVAFNTSGTELASGLIALKTDPALAATGYDLTLILRY